MTQPAFSITIFVAEGKASGLRTIKKANWDGLIIVCPRSRFKDALKDETRKREFSRSGVYILVEPEEDSGLPRLYIGQTGGADGRVKTHLYDPDKGVWQQVIVCTNAGEPPLNESQTKYLEARLYQEVKRYNRFTLTNQNEPKEPPNISESDQANAENYLKEVMALMPIAGIDAFKETPKATEGETIYYVKGKTKGKTKGSIWDAKGFISDNGFTVRKGSKARIDPTSSFKEIYGALWSQLNGTVLKKREDHLVFTQNYEFNSPSQAASVIVGYPVSGPQVWLNEKKESLKEIQDRVNALRTQQRTFFIGQI